MTSDTVTKNIVVGIDGSNASIAALRYAIREGLARHAPVEVVHAWHAHTARDVAFGSPHELQRGSICMLQNEVSAARHEFAETPEITESSVHGRATHVLLEKSHQAQLLVLGVHPAARRDVLVGDVVSALRKKAACPVVVVDAEQNVVSTDSPRAAATTF